MKVVINRRYGGFGLSEEAYKYLKLEWSNYGQEYREDRSNPNLIKVVEALGETANGRFAYLTIVEIPDEVNWNIYDNDGMEHIYDKDRVWGL